MNAFLEYLLKLARPDPLEIEGPYRETVFSPLTLFGGPASGKRFTVNMKQFDTLHVPTVPPLNFGLSSEAELMTRATYRYASYRMHELPDGSMAGYYIRTNSS